jgi:hypothetical protein
MDGSTGIAETVIGTWRLLGLEHQLDDAPWEPAVPSRGRLVYTPDGFVSVFIMYLTSGSVPERFADDELTAYSGRYVLHPGPEVEHLIDLSFRTGWIGSSQRRSVELDGDELVLVTAPFSTSSGSRRSRLCWRREVSP